MPDVQVEIYDAVHGVLLLATNWIDSGVNYNETLLEHTLFKLRTLNPNALIHDTISALVDEVIEDYEYD